MGQGGQQGKSGQQNKLLLNLKLIGGEQKNTRRLRKPTCLETKVLERHEKRKKRQQLAQARAEAAAQSIRSRSGSVVGGTGGNKGLDGSSHHGNHEEKNSKQRSDSVTQDPTRPVTQQPPIARTTAPAPLDSHAPPTAASVIKSNPATATVTVTPTTVPAATTSHNLSSWLSSANVLKNNIASKLQELREEVKDQGLIETMKTKTAQAIAATKVTVDAVYQKAKKKLGDSFQTRIAMLHERLRGGEPIEFPHEFRIQADSITFTDISVSLYHAFPPALRQFEKRSFLTSPSISSSLHLSSLLRSLICRGLYVPMVSLKDVNGSSFSQSIIPNSAPSKSISSDSATVASLKRGDNLDSSIRGKTSTSTSSPSIQIKGITVPPHNPSMDHSSDFSHSQKRRGSNTSVASSPIPEQDFSSSPCPNPTASATGGTRRRRSLKDYASDWKPHKKAIDALSHSDNEDVDEDRPSTCSSSSKVERLLSEESNGSARRKEIPSDGGVWTEVSSVSSDSDEEPHSSSCHSRRRGNSSSCTSRHLPLYPQWSRWLVKRFPTEYDDLSFTLEQGQEQGQGQERREDDIGSAGYIDPVYSCHRDDGTHLSPALTPASASASVSRASSPCNDLMSLSSFPPDLILSGNSVLLSAFEIDEYAMRLVSQSLRSLHTLVSHFLNWTEKYINTFLHATQNFSGVPTCIVVYRLERILLYEILKDNTGRLLQDAWNDLGSSFKNVEEEDDDEEITESSLHLPTTNTSASSHASGLTSSEHPLFPFEV